MADYDFYYGGHNINERTKTHACVLGYDMTCKDCIHDCKKENICDNYADRDGLYSNGTWHCPRCGKEVSAWGLCNECEDSWESVSK